MEWSKRKRGDPALSPPGFSSSRVPALWHGSNRQAFQELRWLILPLDRKGFVMLSRLAQAAVHFLKREDGPTAVEYAVMLALIIVVCIAAITSLGTNANAPLSFSTEGRASLTCVPQFRSPPEFKRSH